MQKSSLFKSIGIYLFVLYTFLGLAAIESKAQLTHKVLFIGNSYTSVNNLPQIIHDVALSAGDTLVFDSNAPGGYQMIDHGADLVTQNKIMTGGWNYVVLQGQSEEPITQSSDFNLGCSMVCQLIRQYNPCAVMMPYMTWGRKNGDANLCPNFPLLCTYEGMDTTLRDRYLTLTSSINGEVSPVSIVWKYLRQNFPNLELYQPDESHPSLAGSYAAACCFYSAIFKKDPTLITFDNLLSATDAAIIRNAVKTVVFDSLQLWDYKRLPVSDFRYDIGPGINEIIFNPMNHGVRQTYLWDFGDGDTSSAVNPTHSYLNNGTYTVTLTTTNCDLQGLHTSVSDTVIQFCSHTSTIYTTHPWLCQNDTLWTHPADSYQWFYYQLALPETSQSLPDYFRYANSGFHVMTTINGCSELSELYTESVVWSGYYFDAIGNPCIGDTVDFAVLHINGFLNGNENILWYKNDSLLPLMTGEDTMFIFSEGTYECKVMDPNSNCPLDTTSSSVLVYDCGSTSIDERDEALFCSLYPNPALETITINFAITVQETIEIYSSIGCLVRSFNSYTSIAKINISDLPCGLYYIRLRNNKQSTLKFIKI